MTLINFLISKFRSVRESIEKLNSYFIFSPTLIDVVSTLDSTLITDWE